MSNTGRTFITSIVIVVLFVSAACRDASMRHGGLCADARRLLSEPIDTASSGNVELVPLGAGAIHVCGYSLIVGGTVDVTFLFGTGTACVTGETDLTGPLGFFAGGGITQSNAGAVQFRPVPAGHALCINTSRAVQVSGHVAYVRASEP